MGDSWLSLLRDPGPEPHLSSTVGTLRTYGERDAEGLLLVGESASDTGQIPSTHFGVGVGAARLDGDEATFYALGGFDLLALQLSCGKRLEVGTHTAWWLLCSSLDIEHLEVIYVYLWNGRNLCLSL